MRLNSKSAGTALLARWASRDDSTKPTSKSRVAGPISIVPSTKEGKTVDVLLRAKRDVAAAKAFFRRAFRGHGRLPHKITLDGYQASRLSLFVDGAIEIQVQRPSILT